MLSGPEARELERRADALPTLALDAAALATLELLFDGALAPVDGFRLRAAGELPALPVELPDSGASAGERFALHDPEGVIMGVLEITEVESRDGHARAGGHVLGLRAPERNLFTDSRLTLDDVRDALAATRRDEHLCVAIRGVPDVSERDAVIRLARACAVLLRVMDPGDPDQAHHVTLRLDAARELAASLGVARCVITVCADPQPTQGVTRDALDGLYGRNAGCRRTVGVGHLHPPAPAPSGGGVCVFFTGLSGSGKSTLARALHARLVEHTGRAVTLLDGDVVRRHLSRGLGFSRADRDLNVARIGYVASRVVMHGGTVICAPIAPYAATRATVRDMVQSHGRFLEVHVSTPLEVCEARDRKGLYAKARAGEIKEFTGISDPYEAPESPDVRLDTSRVSLEQAVDEVAECLLGGC